MKEQYKKAQVGMEYLLIVGFVTFSIILILGIALFYSSTSREGVRAAQIGNFANKIIETAESVYYSGKPSKATVSVYLPVGVDSIEISGNDLFITFQTSSGINKRGFSSNVPLSGALNSNSGLKRIEIIAQDNFVFIQQA